MNVLIRSAAAVATTIALATVSMSISTSTALADDSAAPATDCGSLLKSYVDRGLELVSAHGWGDDFYMYDGVPTSVTPAAAESGGDAAGAPTKAPTSVGSTSSESGTNVQEAGVDEPDVVKVAGSTLFRLKNRVLTTYDVAGRKPKQLSSLDLPGILNAEILVSGDRVIAIGGLGSRYESTGTRVIVIDASTPSAPQIIKQTDYTATLSAARSYGDVVRVVLDNKLPQLDFLYPSTTKGEASALAYNQQLVRDTTLADWIPTVGGLPAFDCSTVVVPKVETELGTTTIVTFDASTAEPIISAIASATTTSYSSPDRLYLAASASRWGWWGDEEADGSTELFAFALAGTSTTYVAAGTVDGMIKDRWSMDFADGALRLALSPTSETGNFNSVVTMREVGGALSEVGRIDKLGVDEEIKSVRWFDTLAIVVTFRQTDPLYAIDLSNADSLALLGKLKIPGFSEYLHPLGTRRLIGIGQDANRFGQTRGAQAALFNVKDLSNPKQIDVVKYPEHSQAGAGSDPRQFTWLPDRRTALTVVSEGWYGRTGWVSVLKVRKGKLKNRMVEVEHGRDVAVVRLVPLASGRVVLVTGNDIEFFKFR